MGRAVPSIARARTKRIKQITAKAATRHICSQDWRRTTKVALTAQKTPAPAVKANVIAAGAKISRNGEVAALQDAYGEVRTDRPS